MTEVGKSRFKSLVSRIRRSFFGDGEPENRNNPQEPKARETKTRRPPPQRHHPSRRPEPRQRHKESRSGDHASLERRLNIHFKNKKLLEQALTHPSYLQKEGKDNARLEFLGDSFLGLVVSHLLYEKNPKANEGDLTKLKSHLVSTKFLGDLGLKMDLGRHLRVSNGDRRMEHPSVSTIADTFESVLGAYYLDSGFQKAYQFVESLFRPHVKIVEREEPENFKGALQEMLQRKYKEQPNYEVVGEHGPEHSKTFEVRAVFRGKIFGTGRGNSKKEAEQAAAKEALAILGRD